MATQDLIEFSDDEAEEDDVQAILAALQSRKEKQQKLKKAIRDRAVKSQKQLKDEVDTSDPILVNIISRMRGYEGELQALVEKMNSLQAIQLADSAEDEEELVEARKTLHELGKLALSQGFEIETRFTKRFQKVTTLIQAESERSHNEDVVQALSELSREIEHAAQALRSAV